MEMNKLAPAFAKLAEAAQEISEIFAAAGGVTLGKRGPGALLLDADGKPIKKKKEKRAPRAPTKFNEFMRKAVAETKEKNKDKSPKEVFALCAAMWKDAPENPKSGFGSLPPAKGDKGSLKSGNGKSKKLVAVIGEIGGAPGRASHGRGPAKTRVVLEPITCLDVLARSRKREVVEI